MPSEGWTARLPGSGQCVGSGKEMLLDLQGSPNQSPDSAGMPMSSTLLVRVEKAAPEDCMCPDVVQQSRAHSLSCRSCGSQHFFNDWLQCFPLLLQPLPEQPVQGAIV